MTALLDRVRFRLERMLFVIAWVGVMTIVAFGAAGIVAGANHPPGTRARAELTWATDQAITPELESGKAQIRQLAIELDQLGSLGRASLAQVAGGNADAINQSIAQGTALVAQINAESDALRARLNALPGLAPDPNLRISAANQATIHALLAALKPTQGLAQDWAGLTRGSIDANRLTGLLAQHDKLIVAAIDASIARKFKTAIARVDDAADQLAEAGKIRDRLKTRGNVATLTEWLRRNRNYDTALRRLYAISARSPNRVTQELRDALAGEKQAREELPKNTDGIVIIMSEIGQGGLNQAVAAVEAARNTMADALNELDKPDSAPAADATLPSH